MLLIKWRFVLLAPLLYLPTATDHCSDLLEYWYVGTPLKYLEIRLIRVAGDTKAGTLIGKDAWGNKYYENLEEELPCKLLYWYIQLKPEF